MSKPSRTTNPSSFQFNNRGRLNGSWLMQWKLMDAITVFTFFFPQFLNAILYKLMALRNSTSMEFNGKIPHGMTVTMDTDSTHPGLWKLHPGVSSRMFTGSHSGNFHTQGLSYTEFYTQAVSSFTVATSIGQRFLGSTPDPGYSSNKCRKQAGFHSHWLHFKWAFSA